MTGPSSWSVLAAGYTPLDILLYQGSVRHSAGGTAGNVTAILAFLGWHSSLIAEYGLDLAGRRARADLRSSDVSDRFVRLRNNFQTPRVLHEVIAPRHRYVFKCPRCLSGLPASRPLSVDRAEEIIATAEPPSVFFFDRLNAGTVRLAEHFAKERSRIIFEPSRPAPAELSIRIMRVADVIKYADNRDPGLEGLLHDAPATQVRIETLGGQGARFRLGNRPWRTSPSFQAPVVDPGGAGDWTTAGFIHSLPQRGRLTIDAIMDALSFAQALASISCGFPGARGLSRRESVDAVLRRATSLERHHSVIRRLPAEPRMVTPRARKGFCPWCLMPLGEPI